MKVEREKCEIVVAACFLKAPSQVPHVIVPAQWSESVPFLRWEEILAAVPPGLPRPEIQMSQLHSPFCHKLLLKENTEKGIMGVQIGHHGVLVSC